MKFVGYLIVFIAGIVSVIALGLSNIYTITPPSVTPDTVTVTEIDTVFTEPEFIFIPKYVAQVHYDTIFQTDTVYITKVAEMDTSFKEGKLNVKYFYAPETFSLTWNPSPIPTIKETKYINVPVVAPYKPTWYRRPDIAFLAGALFTGIIYSMGN